MGQDLHVRTNNGLPSQEGGRTSKGGGGGMGKRKGSNEAGLGDGGNNRKGQRWDQESAQAFWVKIPMSDSVIQDGSKHGLMRDLNKIKAQLLLGRRLNNLKKLKGKDLGKPVFSVHITGNHCLLFHDTRRRDFWEEARKKQMAAGQPVTCRDLVFLGLVTDDSQHVVNVEFTTFRMSRVKPFREGQAA